MIFNIFQWLATNHRSHLPLGRGDHTEANTQKAEITASHLEVCPPLSFTWRHNVRMNNFLQWIKPFFCSKSIKLSNKNISSTISSNYCNTFIIITHIWAHSHFSYDVCIHAWLLRHWAVQAYHLTYPKWLLSKEGLALSTWGLEQYCWGKSRERSSMVFLLPIVR